MSVECGCDGDGAGEVEHGPAVDENAPRIDPAYPVPEGSNAGAAA